MNGARRDYAMSIAYQDTRRPPIEKRKERGFRNVVSALQHGRWELRYALTLRGGNTVHNPHPTRKIHPSRKTLGRGTQAKGRIA
jgi:hypothetical protein